MNNKKITLYQGNTHTDERGTVTFVNDFNFKDVKRFYLIENKNKDFIRAFHGHQKEAKYAYVVNGSILLCAVFVENFKNPSKKAEINKFLLSGKNTQILYIPPNFANGFKSLEPNTKVIFFSTSSLEDSLQDDYRIPYDYWGIDIWKV